MKQILTILLILCVFIMPAKGQHRKFQLKKMYPVTISELTSGIGLSKVNVPYSHSNTGFSTVQGVEIEETVIIGAGTGLSFYNGGLLVPLFIDFRYNYFKNNKYTAYVYGDGGSLFETTNGFEYSKLFINPGTGLNYALSRYFSANFGVGLFVQQGLRRDSFISLKLGISYLLRK